MNKFRTKPTRTKGTQRRHQRFKVAPPEDHNAKNSKTKGKKVESTPRDQRKEHPGDKPFRGIIVQDRKNFYVTSAERKTRASFTVTAKSVNKYDLAEFDLVETKPSPGDTNKHEVICVVARGKKTQKHLSKIATHAYDLPDDFPTDVLQEAEQAKKPRLVKTREDWRHIPLVTIDDETARDYDDAVFAEPDDQQDNPGGWRILVAIADVSHYVAPGSRLDQEAEKRACSAYFPDRVVPMLPEALSNDLCSLRPQKLRYCLGVWLTINSGGKLLDARFHAGIMKSHGKLTYRQVQRHCDGKKAAFPAALDTQHIDHLFSAYKVLRHARDNRGALELDLPETVMHLDETGQVTDISQRKRFAAHELIEEFMILANVAAAERISRFGIARVHDEPNEEKIEELRYFLESHGLTLARGRVHQKSLNRVLQQAGAQGVYTSISSLVLRAQAQALYSPDNIGHYGLNLANYTHFTSPIRRYSDLIVHRLIKALLHDHKAPYTKPALEKICAHISAQERVVQTAERETKDRYAARFYQQYLGQELDVSISHLTESAAFVTLTATGSDGILPYASIIGDYMNFDNKKMMARGRRSGLMLAVGTQIDATLDVCDEYQGRLVFSYRVPRASRGKKTGRGKR